VRISEDLATRVSVEATLRESGVLVLRDSYDPSWRATVDGVPVPVIRANAIYRAVALAPGHHVIRFFYRPRDLTAGLMVSVTTGVLLAVWSFSRRRTSASRPPRGMEGFTLIELMVVLAVLGILLAIAFTQYRGMQARGNEASAVGSLRAIVVAQSQFSLTCAKGKYASTLPGLAQPIPATGEGFLSPDLTPAETFEKSGYVFKMAAKPLDDAPPACNGAAVADGYAVTADPAKPGVSGNRYYGVNADRVLYSDDQQTFTENLGESGPAGHGVEVK
jgi:prepilin-type N-terminal cleavage/methylation domain-containing protein